MSWQKKKCSLLLLTCAVAQYQRKIPDAVALLDQPTIYTRHDQPPLPEDRITNRD